MTGQWGAKSGAKHPPCWQNFPGLHLGVVLFCQRKVESLGGQNGQNPSRFCWELVELSPQILYNLRGYTLWRVLVCFHSSSYDKPVRFTRAWVMSIQHCELLVLITLTPWIAHWFLCSARPEFRGKATQAWMDEWIHNPQQDPPLVSLFLSCSVCLRKGTRMRMVDIKMQLLKMSMSHFISNSFEICGENKNTQPLNFWCTLKTKCTSTQYIC